MPIAECSKPVFKMSVDTSNCIRSRQATRNHTSSRVVPA